MHYLLFQKLKTELKYLHSFYFYSHSTAGCFEAVVQNKNADISKVNGQFPIFFSHLQLFLSKPKLLGKGLRG